MATVDVGKETKKMKFVDRGPGSYLLKAENVRSLYGAFRDIKESRRSVLVLSSNYDHEGFKEVNEFCNEIEELKVYKVAALKDTDHIDPASSNLICDTITKFLAQNGKIGVAATDSFERLRTVNGFEDTLRMLYQIREGVGEGMFIFHVDPRTLKQDELARVEGAATYSVFVPSENSTDKQQAPSYHG